MKKRIGDMTVEELETHCKWKNCNTCSSNENCPLRNRSTMLQNIVDNEVEITEKEYRPFKNLEELKTCIGTSVQVPFVWFKRNATKTLHLMIAVGDAFVVLGDVRKNIEVSFDDLYYHYTFADGEPCGVIED